jgi:hypothetical protein
MTDRRSPQDKKALSYARDRRNDYGENAKSSRKNIPRAKANAKRNERREQNQAVRAAVGAGSEERLVAAEMAATTPQKRRWKKLADIPLGEYLSNKRASRKLVEIEPGDDAGFIALVEAVLARIGVMKPPAIYLTRIDGWFGDRWLGFSGKTLGAAGVHLREDFDIPPFAPSRVVATNYLKRVGGLYKFAAAPVQLHIRQRSESNFRRKLSALVPADALVWFSGGSNRDGRGAIMAYVPAGEGHEPWFVEVVRDPQWRLVRCVGVTAAELQ